MRIKLLQIMAVLGLTLLSLTACGSDSGDGGGVASLSGDSGSDSDSSDDKEQAALDWARCMRDEGVDIPDPETDENGKTRFSGIEVGPGTDIEPEELEAAQKKCGQPPGMEMSNEDQSAMQDAALEFAQCMRDKGYDFPDPEFDANGGMKFTDESDPGSGRLDMSDPQVQKDMNECQEAFEGLGPEDDS